MSQVTVVRGSIFEQDADMIVNPANEMLRNSGGLARVIEDGAGPDFMAACRAHPPVLTGTAAITIPGKLPCKAVVHVVGPVWMGGGKREEWQLRLAHANAFELAAFQGCRKLVLPAISCGVFRYPADLAAQVAIPTALDFINYSGMEIVFAIPEPEKAEEFEKVLEALAL